MPRGCQGGQRRRVYPRMLARRWFAATTGPARDDVGAGSRSSDIVGGVGATQEPRWEQGRTVDGINARPNCRGWTSCRGDEEEEEEKAAPGWRIQRWPERVAGAGASRCREAAAR